jgi:NAD(P)-dependent dehydrogenase (short-subunit alcohol dehydrogenase family)
MIGEDPFDLQGRVALVTGAGQGVGRGIALALAHHNAGGVAVNDFVLERAEAVAAEIRALGVKAAAVQADVGDHASVAAAFAKAKSELGAPATILVNNAGNAGPNVQMGMSPVFWETKPEEWDRFFRTNSTGVMNCCHVAVPDMIEANFGRIVTIVSDAGRVGEQRLAVYSAAKAAAAGFVRALARETGRYNITCNAISLSSIAHPMTAEEEAAFMARDQVKAQLSRYAIRRYGKPDDVALMALLLSSPASSWITGQTYPVNGGYSFAQ